MVDMRRTIGIAATVATLAATTLACAQQRGLPVQPRNPAPVKPTVEVPISTWDFGTRITYFTLLDSTRAMDLSDSFYGSINELRADQDYLPLKFFAEYYFTPFLGVDLMWDQAKITARKRDGHADGQFKLLGPAISLLARYRNETVATPYAGAGLAYFMASFDADYSWKHAVHTDTGFYEHGEPWNQNFYVDDMISPILYAGVSFNVQDEWDVDFCLRYMKGDLEGSHKTFWGDEEIDSTSISFPMDNISFGVGARYSF